jgi:tetratricopeptide (TPR) repeat protein
MTDGQRDFFISFNSADEAHGKAISDALRAEGFTTFFHPDDLEFGGYIPKWMNDALLNSRQMLALCSPEYMAEGAVYSEAERYAWFWRDTRGEKFKLIPVVLKEVEFPPLLAVYKRLMAANTTPMEAAAAVVAALKRPEGTAEREFLGGAQPNGPVRQPAYVHTTRLPETGYERLVGREAELQRLDHTWLDTKINILSLVAEGGAGKSALVNEWIKRMQAHDYPGAEAVLGWSFFSQGTTERTTSAEEFLNWALERLGLPLATTSATAKADAIAEAMMQRRVLLVLDGVEPLQHGPGLQLGQLKDLGLRALLRRFAATPPGASHGLIVLTSRLAVKDIANWGDGAAPVVDIYELSNEAGAALLRDNSVEGPEAELKIASQDFGGHPLALGLLASFLKETQTDIRQRDRIRGLLSDTENPGHDHARRVMESYEREWLTSQPLLLAIMHIIGLFDRPASGDCLNALRSEPVIEGLTDLIVKLRESEWQRAITRLREVRLLAPEDSATPDALDAHPLVREWFGERLRLTNPGARKEAHSRLYEHLRDTTKEGGTPTLRDLAPLYQAVSHGCNAGRHQEALDEVFYKRICRGGDAYSVHKLGAFSNDLAAVSCFYEEPYQVPVETLSSDARAWVVSDRAFLLRALGRFGEMRSLHLEALRMHEEQGEWVNAAICMANLCEVELIVGEVSTSLATAEKAVALTDRSGDKFLMIAHRTMLAEILRVAGEYEKAADLFAVATRDYKKLRPDLLYLPERAGYNYCKLLLDDHQYKTVFDQATKTIAIALRENLLVDIALDSLTLGRATLGFVSAPEMMSVGIVEMRSLLGTVQTLLDRSVSGLKEAASFVEYLPSALLSRSGFLRSLGDWTGALRDLKEVEEIAEPAPMRIFLCDLALERARLAFAKAEAFAPFNGASCALAPKPEKPDNAERKSLHEEAAQQLVIAANYIHKCGYHRRDEELAELQAVLHREKTFAELRPRF